MISVPVTAERFSPVFSAVVATFYWHGSMDVNELSKAMPFDPGVGNLRVYIKQLMEKKVLVADPKTTGSKTNPKKYYLSAKHKELLDNMDGDEIQSAMKAESYLIFDFS